MRGPDEIFGRSRGGVGSRRLAECGQKESPAGFFSASAKPIDEQS
jgi:hypothetical protein